MTQNMGSKKKDALAWTDGPPAPPPSPSASLPRRRQSSSMEARSAARKVETGLPFSVPHLPSRRRSSDGWQAWALWRGRCRRRILTGCLILKRVRVHGHLHWISSSWQDMVVSVRL